MNTPIFVKSLKLCPSPTHKSKRLHLWVGTGGGWRGWGKKEQCEKCKGRMKLAGMKEQGKKEQGGKERGGKELCLHPTHKSKRLASLGGDRRWVEGVGQEGAV